MDASISILNFIDVRQFFKCSMAIGRNWWSRDTFSIVDDGDVAAGSCAHIADLLLFIYFFGL